MLKHCVPSALVLAQLALAGPLALEPRDDVGGCLPASTITTTIVEQVTLTVTTDTGLWGDSGTTPSQCHPPSTDIDVTSSSLPTPYFSRITTGIPFFTRISSLDIETTSGNQQPTDTAQPAVPPPSDADQPTVEPSAVAVPVATQGPEIPPAKRGLNNMLYFGSW